MGNWNRWTDSEVEYLEEHYHNTPNRDIANELDRTKSSISHKGRRVGLEKDDVAILSDRVDKISPPPVGNKFSQFVSGLVAGDGCFTNSTSESGREKYAFQLELGKEDEDIVRDIYEFFTGVGYISETTTRDGWQDQIMFAVSDQAGIIGSIIPFFDNVDMYSSKKGRQYYEWRENFVSWIPEGCTEEFKWL